MGGNEDYLSGDEQRRFQELIKLKGAAWVAQELRVHAHDIVDAARGDDIEEDFADDIRRLLARR